ncbi:head GIN domain-containing protein [Piscinibacter sp.]|uniref:head GIN domain-containing protein n=1 Tax=Piscinibacter sp. TaxID=1903157 RepID=UPI002B5F92A9|nr:head GIN domain-containing protein [Albitalea sp.]HUG25749.1 head GIN domain-containing protein [Albitalea sp.]
MLPARVTPLNGTRLRAGMFAALFLVFLVPSARADDTPSWFERMLGRQQVVGSGKLQSQTRPAHGFNAVSVGGSMTVVLRQGGREGVEVHADDNLLPFIETTVEDGTLRIGVRKGVGYSTRNPVVVTVDLTRLDQLSLGGSGEVVGPGLQVAALSVSAGGSGRVHLPDLQARALRVSLGGSGEVEASGTAQRVELSVGGSGTVDAQALEADEVSVSIGGSGDVSVHARRKLTASVAGSGDVVYRGDPAVERSIVGSGSVEKKR